MVVKSYNALERWRDLALEPLGVGGLVGLYAVGVALIVLAFQVRGLRRTQRCWTGAMRTSEKIPCMQSRKQGASAYPSGQRHLDLRLVPHHGGESDLQSVVSLSIIIRGGARAAYGLDL
jgi:hypothetical protein